MVSLVVILYVLAIGSFATIAKRLPVLEHVNTFFSALDTCSNGTQLLTKQKEIFDRCNDFAKINNTAVDSKSYQNIRCLLYYHSLKSYCETKPTSLDFPTLPEIKSKIFDLQSVCRDIQKYVDTLFPKTGMKHLFCGVLCSDVDNDVIEPECLLTKYYISLNKVGTTSSLDDKDTGGSASNPNKYKLSQKRLDAESEQQPNILDDEVIKGPVPTSALLPGNNSKNQNLALDKEVPENNTNVNQSPESGTNISAANQGNTNLQNVRTFVQNVTATVQSAKVTIHDEQQIAQQKILSGTELSQNSTVHHSEPAETIPINVKTLNTDDKKAPILQSVEKPNTQNKNKLDNKEKITKLNAKEKVPETSVDAVHGEKEAGILITKPEKITENIEEAEEEYAGSEGDNADVNEPQQEPVQEVEQKTLERKPDTLEENPINTENLNEIEDESYFMTYFMVICVAVVLGYVGYHNRIKVMALLLEGKRNKRQYRNRRPNSANYHKLDSNLEEAISSNVTKNLNNVIY